MTTAAYYNPEKLSLWDRIFNRYKTIPIKEDTETWQRRREGYRGQSYIDCEYYRDYVIYHKVDRLTGGYEITKVYLN